MSFHVGQKKVSENGNDLLPNFNWKSPGAVASQFFRDDKFVRGIRGPLGSGKSATCVAKIWHLCSQVQEPSKRTGARRSRWLITRNTGPILRSTTIPTWLEWLPEEEYGHMRWSPYIEQKIRLDSSQTPDGIPIEADFLFIGLDRPQDVKRVLSMDLTGAWVNEAREVDKHIVDAITARVNRYPPLSDGGATEACVLMDTNAMDDDHWWPLISGEVPLPDWMSEEDAITLRKPANWSFYNQPGALEKQTNQSGRVTGYHLNEARENKDNLPADYYLNLMTGKSADWVNLFVLNELGALAEGRAIYKGQFNRTFHVRKTEEPFEEGKRIVVGMDFGLTPAAVFLQEIGFGRWRIVREACFTDMGPKRFGQRLKLFLNANVPRGTPLQFCGDPAGVSRGSDENTPFRILKAMGIPAYKAPTNDPTLRIEAVENLLNSVVEGQPAIEINPSCKTLIRGFEAHYVYDNAGNAKKNRYSHPHDALQYAVLGAGLAADILISDSTNTVSMQQKPKLNVLERHRSRRSNLRERVAGRR